MIELLIDFDADWPLWQRLCHAFWTENGYWADDEMPGWIRATQLIHDIRLYQDEHRRWAIIYFLRGADKTAFLLQWA